MFVVQWDLGRLFKRSVATMLYYILVELPELKNSLGKMFILITTGKYKLLFIFIQQKLIATVLK